MELVVWQPYKPGPRIILGVKNDETAVQAAERYEYSFLKNPELNELLKRQPFPLLPKANFTALKDDDFQRRYLMITNMPQDLRAKSERVRSIIDPWAKEGAEVYLLPMAADLGLTEAESTLFIEMLDNQFMSFIAIGGDDVDRRVRGGENVMSRFTNLVRDTFEYRLVQRKALTITVKLMNRKDRLLGICRGAQLIAFALGHNLGNDIDHEVNGGVKHGRGTGEGYSGEDGLHPAHPVRALKTANSLFYKIAGQVSEFLSNSYHHQWMILKSEEKPLVDLKVSGISPQDGLTEAAEFEDSILLMQMHMEFMLSRGEGEMKAMGARLMKNTLRWFVPGATCEGLVQ